MSDGDRVSIGGNAAREILDNLVEGCQLIGFDFSCLYVNESFVAQIRQPREQLLGHGVTECYPGTQKTSILSFLRRSMAERTHQQTQCEFVFPDGSSRCYDLRFIPVLEGVCILFVDITDRRKTEESLRRLEAQFALLYDSVADPIFLLSVELGGGFRFASINRSFLAATGLPFDRVVGRLIEEVLPEPSQALVLAKYNQAIVERRRITWEEVSAYPAGTKVAEVTVAPMFDETEQRCTHLVGSVHDMTEQKQIERALKRSEREFRAIFDQAPLGIAVIDSRTGRFCKVNQQYCAIVGYSETEMLARTFQSITHPDDLQKDLDGMGCLLDGKLHSYQIEKRYFRKDGAIVWVSLTCVALADTPGRDLQHIAIIDDITDRKLADNRLAESERKYRMLVEHANSIILRWNSDGRIIFLNEFGQRFFGYSEDEIIGRHVIGTIVAPAESSGRDLRRLIDQICTDPAAFEQNTNENMRRNGERVWIAWTNRVVRDSHGQGMEFLSVGTDITARRLAEEEVRRLNEDLRRHAGELERRVAERTAELAVARDRAQAADRLKSAFLATMSHELRTPLNSIIGFTGIVLKGLAGPLTAEQQKQLDMVRSSARHLLNLINDVLDISKIEAGELTVQCEPVDLQEAVAKAAGIVKPLAERKGLALRVEVPPGLGQTLSDERRVQQVLLNLLTNAVKFTEEGEVALIVEVIGNAVHMRVEDTGIGIKPEDLAIVFQPFRQLDSGTTRNHEGTGLGLAICRRLAELMDGEVRVTSEWGRGSAFTLTLPLRGPIAE